jgi:uncharacterized protein YecE (DUF72 family)
MEIHIGCSGWFYWGWRGKFYPLTVPTHRWFPYYTQHFKTVELNAPFYSWPKRSTVQCWIRQAPPDFLYSIKVNRYITHDFRMEGTAMLVEQFYLDVGEPLAAKMACFLFQFPPSFRYTKKRLDAICKQLDPRYRNVVEFRHRSWWHAEVYRALRRRKIIMCAVSAPRIPDKLVRTADDIYVRLHGTSRWYRHDYSDEELAEWAAKIRASGARRAWVYFDNDRDAHAIKNAKRLREMLMSEEKQPNVAWAPRPCNSPRQRPDGRAAARRERMGEAPMPREEKLTPVSTTLRRTRNPTRRNTDSARQSRPRRAESRPAPSAAKLSPA